MTSPPADLIATVLRLAASGWATPERIQRVIAGRLDARDQPDARAVVDALCRAAVSDGALRALEARTQRELADVGAEVRVVGYAGYPARLADAWPELGAPVWLFVRAPGGRVPDGRAVAVVGTRHPTLDGLRTAREVAQALGRAGITVVSGMARGIDQAAHRGALDAGGRTVAVLGTGFAVDYPRGDGALREEIAASGGLVTELAPGAPPKPPHFLWRNRILAGLADLTVVVEGRARSGALQTARLAAAQGREVWAVPGSIHAPTSRGPLDLVRDGAQLVTRVDDVLAAVAELPQREPGPAAAPALEGLDAPAQRVLALLGPVPASPSAITAASELPVAEVLEVLGELTARGLALTTPRGIVAAR